MPNLTAQEAIDIFSSIVDDTIADFASTSSLAVNNTQMISLIDLKLKLLQVANNVGQNLDGYIQDDEKGTANGVATLDANGTIPQEQLPPLSTFNVDGGEF